MGFWDRRVVDQVMGELRKLNWDQYVSRLPDEYQAGLDALRVRIMDGTWLDMITIDAEWFFVLVLAGEDGMPQAREERHVYSARLRLTTYSKEIARRLIEGVDEARHLVQQARLEAEQERLEAVTEESRRLIEEMAARAEKERLVAMRKDGEVATRESETPGPASAQAVDLDEVRLAGLANSTQKIFVSAGIECDIDGSSTPFPRIAFDMAGAPAFQAEPADGCWWFFWAKDGRDIGATEDPEEVECFNSALPLDAHPEVFALIACQVLLKFILLGPQEASCGPRRRRTAEQVLSVGVLTLLAGHIVDEDALAEMSQLILADVGLDQATLADSTEGRG